MMSISDMSATTVKVIAAINDYSICAADSGYFYFIAMTRRFILLFTHRPLPFFDLLHESQSSFHRAREMILDKHVSSGSSDETR